MNEEKGMVSQEAVAATSADTGSIMPLAADLSKTQDVTKVSEVSTINSTDQFYMNQSGKFVQVDYSKLADAILGKISSKTYSLDQGTKTLIAAINELNSKSKNMLSKTMQSTSDILETALSLPDETLTFVSCSGSGYTGEAPNISYKYGTGIILKRNANSLSVIWFSGNIGWPPIFNSRISDAWQGWTYFNGTKAD